MAAGLTTVQKHRPPVACICRQRGGYWLRVDIHPPPRLIERARADVRRLREYHASGRTADRAYTHRADALEPRLAEYIVGDVLHQSVTMVVTSGPLRRRPDLSGHVGVRWSRTDWLLFRGRRYADRPDPNDEPEVLVQGDGHRMSLLGWATMADIDRDDWYEPWECWRIHRDRLHLLPVPKADGRPIWARHGPER